MAAPAAAGAVAGAEEQQEAVIDALRVRAVLPLGAAVQMLGKVMCLALWLEAHLGQCCLLAGLKGHTRG